MERHMSLPSESASAHGLPDRIGTCVEHLRHRWGWFVALGVLMFLLGFAALLLVVSATIASVYTIAIFLIIAGGAEIALGFSSRSWGRFFLWIIGGIAYIVVGAFALARPLMAAAVFTLLLGVAMLVTGVIRVYMGTHLGKGVRGSVIFAGVVTAIVGFIIILGWPSNSFVVLGLLLGIDLMIWGASWIMLGLRMKARAEAMPALGN
jgi:uncharacterized membrane protein HdeD (DUF308 family)